MQAINFDEVLERILAQDPRYHREAYLFVREGLDHAQKLVSKATKDEVRHVTGQELLAGIREYALAQYGPMAQIVLNEWGVHRCEDFGELVFNMVENGLLSKTETDSRDDFKGGYDFAEAFQKPFRPAGKAAPSSTPESKPTEA
ncbi:MAG: hypothetical protein FJ403_15275 [Verrucomicrobia bacterium]|nr:hypothetical protein [Verrucomicrobiota bacterium]